jgi:hypothetical protein
MNDCFINLMKELVRAIVTDIQVPKEQFSAKNPYISFIFGAIVVHYPLENFSSLQAIPSSLLPLQVVGIC